MKVVINTCFGGFGLSDQAVELLLGKKGIEFEKQDLGALDLTHYYRKGHVGKNEHYISIREITDNRADPDLIAVVEQLGVDANGWAAELKIVEIPDDVQWFIDEYDGAEHVAEAHRTWR